MAGCCNPRGCDKLFGPRFARRMATRYRKRGLDRTARRMVEFLELRGIEGATVLEIGGGVGEIQIELLKRGAARSVNLELSSAYDEEATRLLREAALEDRAERRLHDIAVEPDGVESADIVVLHRVVCCYPDYERLLGAAAQRAGRLLVFSYPPRNAVSRLFISCGEPRFQAAPAGVSELRPSAGGDARPTWRARASAHVRPSQSPSGRSLGSSASRAPRVWDRISPFSAPFQRPEQGSRRVRITRNQSEEHCGRRAGSPQSRPRRVHGRDGRRRRGRPGARKEEP